MNPHPATDDNTLVATLFQAAANGDSQAWDALVQRFSGLVWSITRAHRLNTANAADVNQTVWLRLVENLDRIRQPDRVGAWLAAVTRHECLRVIRKTGREIPTASPEPAAHQPAHDIDTHLLDHERHAALLHAIERLPPQWRTLTRLLMADPPPSYQEIAAGLGIPIGTIGPTRQRILQRLRTTPELTDITT